MKELYAQQQTDKRKHTTKRRRALAKQQTWCKFLEEELKEQLVQVGNIGLYARRRIQVHKTYQECKIKEALMDFTTALFLCSLPKKDQDMWLDRAQSRLITVKDIKESSSMLFIVQQDVLTCVEESEESENESNGEDDMYEDNKHQMQTKKRCVIIVQF